MKNRRPIDRDPLVRRSSVRGSGRVAAVLALGLVLGTIFGTVGIVRYVPAAKPEGVASFNERPARELPREWRWERQPVDYQHMYRNKSPQQLDWIRR